MGLIAETLMVPASQQSVVQTPLGQSWTEPTGTPRPLSSSGGSLDGLKVYPSLYRQDDLFSKGQSGP